MHKSMRVVAEGRARDDLAAYRVYGPHTPARGGRSFAIMIAVLLACLALQLALPLATMPLRVSWNYGEGWNAYWAARAMAGAPLYTRASSAITDNYPPLSFYLVGAVGRLASDQIIGGRIVSLAALCACVAMVGGLAARLGAGGRWGAAAAAAFLLYVGCFAWRYIASDDPQWLAASFTLAALLVLVGPSSAMPSRRRLAAAGVLLILGGLIKHNELAAPAAITVWLAARDRRGLAMWLVSGAVLTALALALLWAVFGPLLFSQVIGHHRVLRAGYLLSALATLSGLLPEIGLTVMLWAAERRRPADRRIALMLIFTVTAIVLGALERMGTGVAANAQFDAAIGCFVLAGVALGRGDVLSCRARMVMSVVALAPLVIGTAVSQPRRLRLLSTLGSADTAWADAIRQVRASPGPVACELPAMCYWAGRPFGIDFYNYGQKLRTIGDPIDLYGQLRRRRFATIVVVRDRRFREGDARLPERYNLLIASGYRVARALPDDALLLVRR